MNFFTRKALDRKAQKELTTPEMQNCLKLSTVLMLCQKITNNTEIKVVFECIGYINRFTAFYFDGPPDARELHYLINYQPTDDNDAIDAAVHTLSDFYLAQMPKERTAKDEDNQ